MDMRKHARGLYLRATDVREGDLITFMNSGVLNEKTGRPEFEIKLPDEFVMRMSLFPDSVAALIEAWGADSKEWVGNIAKISLQDYTDQKGEQKKAINLIPHQRVNVRDNAGPDIPQEEIPIEESENIPY